MPHFNLNFNIFHKLTRGALILLITLTIALVLVVNLRIIDQPLISRDADWQVNGTFVSDDSVYPSTGSLQGDNSKGITNKDLQLWRSWAGDDRNTGTIVSPDFRAPSILSMFLSGYPSTNGNKIFLERVDTKEKLELKSRELSETWVDMRWLLPPDWHGVQVHLVAIDGSQKRSDWLSGKGAWLGISSPRSISLTNLLLSQFSFLTFLPLYFFHFLVFLLPGFLISIYLIKLCHLNRLFLLGLSIIINCLIGYITFWVYFVNHYWGSAFSISIALGTIYFVFSHFKKGSKRNLLKQNIFFFFFFIPTLLMFAIGIFYIALLFNSESSQIISADVDVLSQSRFFSRFPLDNTIPMLFSEHLYKGTDPRQIKELIGMLSSDRPPLQSGMVLVQRPLMFFNLSLQYQIISTIFQCSWIPAIWALCRAINLSARKIAILFSFLIFSGFFLFNSLFTWPKLLPASLVIFAFAIVLQKLQHLQKPSDIETNVAVMSTSLAMLAHGGVIFTIPSIVILVLRLRCLPTFRGLWTSFCILLALFVPWKAYQILYDPPGNRLTKWHIAGVIEYDTRSDIQTIIDSYHSLDLSHIINNKWQNVQTLFGNFNLYGIRSIDWRTGEFFHLFNALGILNIGWVILLLSFILRRKIQRSILLIMEIVVISLVTWILLMFGPSTTIIHSGSYATVMLVFFGLAILITDLPFPIVFPILSIHTLIFSFSWIFDISSTNAHILSVPQNLPMVILSIISLAIIIIINLAIIPSKFKINCNIT